jgi:riboflavin transporter FmnP
MKHENIRKLTVMAMLVAVSVILVWLVHFPLFPTAAFLEYDPADIPILIGTFAYGPVAGILLTVVASATQMLTVSAQSGLYGCLMHVISTSLLSVTAGIIYRFNHTRKGAAISVTCGTLGMGLAMILANHFITPIFMGVPVAVVDKMLLSVFLPFNLLKAGLNALITFLVYKPISKRLIKSI